jgi:hypothetical protein
MSARGLPERSSSVRRPLGVVLSLLARLSGGRETAVAELEVLAVERERESKEAREPRADELLPFEDEGVFVEVETGSESVTICGVKLVSTVGPGTS